MSANKCVAYSHRGEVRPGVGLPERAQDAKNHAVWQRSARSWGGINDGLGVLRREEDVFSENKGEGRDARGDVRGGDDRMGGP